MNALDQVDQTPANGYLSLGEAARALKVTKPRVSQLIAEGSLRGMLIGGRRVVEHGSLERYAEGAHERGQNPTPERFTLMSADYEVAQVSYTAGREAPLAVGEVLDAARMPFGTLASTGSPRPRAVNDWWLHRSVPSSRPGMLSKLEELGVGDVQRLPLRSLGLSLSDCYWLRPAGHEDLAWGSINYFENDFTGAGSDTWDEWLGAVGLGSPDNTSEGELPKRWAIDRGARVLVKGCTTDDQRPFNEVVATALHRRLLREGEYVPYSIVHVQNEPACLCPDFLTLREEYIPATYVRGSLGNTRGSSTYDRFARYAGRWLCDENAARTALSQMIVCDSVIANGDRHWRNFGFIRSVDTLEMRPAPLFDSGNSLWFDKPTGALRAGDWSFPARPFDLHPERQLALADRLDWFDPARLQGFADEAVEILRGSSSAYEGGRIDRIAQGLQRRVQEVSTAVEVLRHVPR